jgi:hypothetical protein
MILIVFSPIFYHYLFKPLNYGFWNVSNSNLLYNHLKYLKAVNSMVRIYLIDVI